MQNQYKRLFSLGVLTSTIFALAACNQSPSETTNEPTAPSDTDLQAASEINVAPIAATIPAAAESDSMANTIVPSSAVTPVSVGSNRAVTQKAPVNASPAPLATASSVDLKVVPHTGEHSDHNMEGRSDREMPGM